MSTTLTTRHEKLIAQMLESGRFHDREDVLSAALRLLDEHESRQRETALDDFLRQRAEDPGFTPTSADWSALRARVSARATPRRHGKTGR